MPANNHDRLSIYNKQAVWDEHCLPVLRKLVILCNIYEIPLFVTACVSNDRKGSFYVADMVNPDIKSIMLKDDHIPKHLAVMRGYDIYLPDENSIVPQMDDLDEIFLD